MSDLGASSFNMANRTRSTVRFAVDQNDPNERDGSLGKLSNANGFGIESRGSTTGIDSPGNSMMGIQVNGNGNSSHGASNPAAKMTRSRSISKSFSSLELQFQAQQADKYDTLPLKLGKAFTAIFALLVCTAAFVLSKSSMIKITEGVKTDDQVSFGKYTVKMLYIITLPLLTTLFSDLLYWWVRETKEKKIDPKAKRVRTHAIVLIGAVEGMLEAVGISIFFLMVLPISTVDSFTKIFLLNGLCVVPIVCALVMKWKKWLKPKQNNTNIHDQGTDANIDIEEASSYKKKDGSDFCSRIVVTGVQLVFLSMQLAGMGLLMYATKLWWEIPVSLILTSASWWKNFVFLDRMEPHWTDAFKRHRYASSFIKTVFKISFIYMITAIIIQFKWNFANSYVFDHNTWFEVIKESRTSG